MVLQKWSASVENSSSPLLVSRIASQLTEARVSESTPPAFERENVLTDKYGEDAKLIFDLQDQGGAT